VMSGEEEYEELSSETKKNICMEPGCWRKISRYSFDKCSTCVQKEKRQKNQQQNNQKKRHQVFLRQLFEDRNMKENLLKDSRKTDSIGTKILNEISELERSLSPFNNHFTTRSRPRAAPRSTSSAAPRSTSSANDNPDTSSDNGPAPRQTRSDSPSGSTANSRPIPRQTRSDSPGLSDYRRLRQQQVSISAPVVHTLQQPSIGYRCIICHDEQDATALFTTLHCTHKFHTVCVSSLRNMVCPLCRAPIAGFTHSTTPTTTTIAEEFSSIADEELDQNDVDIGSSGLDWTPTGTVLALNTTLAKQHIREADDDAF